MVPQENIASKAQTILHSSKVMKDSKTSITKVLHLFSPAHLETMDLPGSQAHMETLDPQDSQDLMTRGHQDSRVPRANMGPQGSRDTSLSPHICIKDLLLTSLVDQGIRAWGHGHQGLRDEACGENH